MSALGTKGLITTDAAFDATRVNQSAWFDGSADHLDRTPSLAGDRRTWTISVWLRRTGFGANSTIIGTITGGGNFNWIYFNSSDQLVIASEESGGVTARTQASNRVFRDTAWFHLVISWDTTQVTAADRCRAYVNGEEITWSSATYRLQNDQTSWNNTVEQAIGQTYGGGGQFFNGYMAQFTNLDGYSIPAGDIALSDLGESYTAGNNGTIWSPLADTDLVTLAQTAGGQSFCLTSAIGSGTDASSLSNDFTATSMSHAANGSDNTPSNVHAVLNVLTAQTSTFTISEGAQRVAAGTTGNLWTGNGTVYSGGKLVFEATLNTASTSGSLTYIGFIGDNGSQVLYRNDGEAFTGSWSAFGSSWSVNDNFRAEVDQATGDVEFFRNGSSEGTVSGTNLQNANYITLRVRVENSADLSIRTSESDFIETPTSGFLPINTANLPTPQYQGADYFNAVLYTGDATNDRSITGMGFASDFLWGKKRSAALSHKLQDVIRGANNILYSDVTNAEQVEAGYDSINDTDGFTIDNANNTNDSGATYVHWGFKAGGAGVSNTDGSITSTVSVADAGHFSIGTYTGNGTGGATVGHGLGGVPEFYFVKNRDSAQDWRAYHAGIAADAETDYVSLNLTNAAADDSIMWNDTAPTSTVFSLGTANAVNQNTSDFVFYAFRSVPGLCLVRSYTGNGSADGPYVYCGFKPRWIIIKVTTQAYSWYINDSARNPYNAADLQLFADNSNAEGTGDNVDILSDGFKVRDSGVGKNQSGQNYIFIAIADVAGGGDLPPIPGR